MLFPSPCGDKLKHISGKIKTGAFGFPSPCGDKLKFEITYFHPSSMEVSVPLRG